MTSDSTIGRRQWREGSVDRSSHHFEIKFGNPDADIDRADWTLVARVGAPQGSIFPVEFVVTTSDEGNAEMLTVVRKELDYYLVEKGERNPLGYMQHHCGTAANLYSSAFWSFCERRLD